MERGTAQHRAPSEHNDSTTARTQRSGTVCQRAFVCTLLLSRPVHRCAVFAQCARALHFKIVPLWLLGNSEARAINVRIGSRRAQRGGNWW